MNKSTTLILTTIINFINITKNFKFQLLIRNTYVPLTVIRIESEKFDSPMLLATANDTRIS